MHATGHTHTQTDLPYNLHAHTYTPSSPHTDDACMFGCLFECVLCCGARSHLTSMSVTNFAFAFALGYLWSQICCIFFSY